MMTSAELLGTMAAFWIAAVAVLVLARLGRTIADAAEPRSDRPLWVPALERERQQRREYAWAYARLADIVAAVTEPDPAQVVHIGRPPVEVLAQIREVVAA